MPLPGVGGPWGAHSFILLTFTVRWRRSHDLAGVDPRGLILQFSYFLELVSIFRVSHLSLVHVARTSM